MSEKFEALMMRVWREACRHIELPESTATITGLLRDDLPIGSLLVRQFDFSGQVVKTLAIGQFDEAYRPALTDSGSSRVKWERLLAWASTGELLRSPANRRSGEMAILIPDGLEGEAIAGPLTGAGGTLGALVLTLPINRALSDRDIELFRALLEPFSVAIENHLRMHELSTLREAADSEKRHLLKRFGKNEPPEDIIVGAESGLRRIMERIDLVAGSDVPVLILGETGTGKEVVSRAIHSRSSRAAGPFIRVNCGAIPSELIDSQLFGHERGSFTGADSTRHRRRRSGCCGSCKIRSSTGSVVKTRSASTSGSSPRPIATSRRWSEAAHFAKTCGTGSMSFPWRCRRCGIAPRTSRSWPVTSPNGPRPDSGCPRSSPTPTTCC
jgi:hypothetical protein